MRLGELADALARKSRLIARPVKLPQPPDAIRFADDQTIGRWLDQAAAHIDLEAEPVDSLYVDIDLLVRTSAPAILRAPGALDQNQPAFIALLRSTSKRATVITPELRLKKVRVEALHALLCAPTEGGLGYQIDLLLDEVQVPEDRRQQARKAILAEQLGPVRIQAGWLLRLPPGASLHHQFRHNDIYRPAALVFIMYLVQQLLAVATWFVIGRGVFQGHFDMGWLIAWAILLLMTIPIQVIVSNAQSELSMGSGAIFKQRLLHGTLKLEPEEIRKQGMGQFLGRVMDSEAVEMLALTGGFMALLSVIEIILAMIIFTKGAGGWLQVGLLFFWVLFTIGLMFRNAKISRDWADAYREMTNDLVERMVGHRTRLAQEDPEDWHEEEDQALDRYLKLSETLDNAGNQLNGIALRGWLLIGMLGVVIPYISGNATPQALAISLGGVLLASQALGKMASGSQSLVGLAIAWRQVEPLFNAASRPVEKASLNLLPATQLNHSPSNAGQAYISADQDLQPLLMARELYFRYRPQGKAVLQGCNLQIYPGERVLLEGPSGGGKSTLAAVLTGLRQPEAGSLLLWGFDRRILGSEEWRQRVVMAPQFQENHVFSETFAFNLLLGRRWPAQPEDLRLAEEICRELGLGEVLDRMPSGFQQMLGESGWQLSHGERSRLYIARALLQKADLIILDESFGALDPENLYRALRCVLDRASYSIGDCSPLI